MQDEQRIMWGNRLYPLALKETLIWEQHNFAMFLWACWLSKWTQYCLEIGNDIQHMYYSEWSHN